MITILTSQVLVNTVDVMGNFLVLGRKDITSYVIMSIGESEAFSIRVALEGLKFSRPLSHDLMKNIIDISGFKPVKVVIYDVKDGAYLAKIYIEKGFWIFKQKVILDSRPSDAVALALRYGIPIYVMPKLLMNPLKVKPDTTNPIDVPRGGIEG